MLSARQHGEDKVEALDLGADDYVTKPFAMNELMAAARRRTTTGGRRAPEQATITYRRPRRRHAVQAVARKQLRTSASRRPSGPSSSCSRATWGGWCRASRSSARWGAGVRARDPLPARVYAARRHKLEDDPAHPRHLITSAGLATRWSRGRPARKVGAMHARKTAESAQSCRIVHSGDAGPGQDAPTRPLSEQDEPNRASPAYRMSRLWAAPAYKTRRLDLARGEVEDGRTRSVRARRTVLVVRPGLEQHRQIRSRSAPTSSPRVHGDGATTEGDRRVLGGAQVGHPLRRLRTAPVRADDVPRVPWGHGQQRGGAQDPDLRPRHLEDEPSSRSPA